MNKPIIIALLLAIVISRDYPIFKQCDQRWGGQNLGTSPRTLCQAGCVVTSVAMALAAIRKDCDPGTLNSWLKDNDGYVKEYLFVWRSVCKLGLNYQGKIAKEDIAANLKAGNVVIMNVLNGGHWVLATNMVDDNSISVNDPLYDRNSYSLSEVMANNSAVYQVSAGYMEVMVDEVQVVWNVNGRKDKMGQADGTVANQ